MLWCYHHLERIDLLAGANHATGGIRNRTEEDCRWVGDIKYLPGAVIPVERLMDYGTLFHQALATLQARKALLLQ